MTRQDMTRFMLMMVLLMAQVTTNETQPSSSPENHQFNAEVNRLMDILVNSLYTQKEIFLRELISNASDALDKLRFMALTDPDVLGEQKQLEIRVDISEDGKFITVKDTGVGMTRNELIENLGTIAKSGTTNFIEALKNKNLNLIGQFGVGFYSTFLAGAKVEVISKSNTDQQYIWTAETAASYEIDKDPNGNTLGRGTQVKIFLKDDAAEFLSHRKIAKLIRKYSQFIDFPIYLNNKKEVDVKEEEETVEKADLDEENPKQTEESPQDAQDKPKDGEDKPKKKTIYEWERINTNKAIWLREKDDIYEEDYVEFYKSLTRHGTNPLNWIHFNTEGEVVFSSILYIPAYAPHDFYSNFNHRKNQLKLYVRRVLIAEKHTELIPRYLSFVEGVIDSDDLPLSVSRETLQQTKTFKVINQKITKKILDMIGELANFEEAEEEDYEDELGLTEEEQEKLSEEELEAKKEEAKKAYLKKKKENYEKFYDQFGKALKLGILDDKTNRNKLASLTRWHSTNSTTELTSFDDYIKRMKSIQDQIYFFSGEDRVTLGKSPLVSGLVRKGYEVILCDDPIDEYVFNVLRDYNQKNIVNVGKGDFKMPDDDELERKKLKVIAKKYEPFVQFAKKLLFERVSNVIISNRLTSEPCVVVADSYGPSSFMDKIQKAQMFGNSEEAPSPISKKILEINPHHKVNQIILKKIQDGETTSETEELVELLYETAAFHSGFAAPNPNEFINRFYKTYTKALGVVMERREIEIDEDISLDQRDPNEDQDDIIRLDDMVIGGGEED